MTQRSKKTEIALTIIWIAILAVTILLQSLPVSPVYNHLEADSGVYAYVGSAILEEQLPYRDVWEQKPPVGFYLDALALLFGHTPWAIWWLNVIWVSLTCIVFFLLIKKMMGGITACLASLLFAIIVMYPQLFQGGNLMEVYGLLFQVLVIGAVFSFFATSKTYWVFLSGIFTGLAFLTKQTTIALGVSSILAIIIVSLLQRELKHAFLRPLLFVGGLIAPIFLAASYWVFNSAGYDFLDAVFLHSLAYVGARVSFLWSLKNTILNVLPGLFIKWLYYIAVGAFILYVLENYRWYLARLRRDRDAQPKEISPVELTLLGVFIALPVEIAFASLGARNFGHYFITLVPAGATVTAYIVWKTTNGIQRAVEAKKFSSLLLVGWLLLFLVTFFWLFTAAIQDVPTPTQLASIKSIFSNKYTLNELEQYIIKTTDPSDRVLVWHVHTGINFITKRKAAARVLFPFNLFIIDWRGNTKLDGFIHELETNPPELILVQKPNSAGLPFIDESLDGLCDKGCMPEITEALKQPVIYAEMKTLQDFFNQKYVLDKQIYDWNIYRLIH